MKAPTNKSAISKIFKSAQSSGQQVVDLAKRPRGESGNFVDVDGTEIDANGNPIENGDGKNDNDNTGIARGDDHDNSKTTDDAETTKDKVKRYMDKKRRGAFVDPREARTDSGDQIRDAKNIFADARDEIRAQSPNGASASSSSQEQKALDYSANNNNGGSGNGGGSGGGFSGGGAGGRGGSGRASDGMVAKGGNGGSSSPNGGPKSGNTVALLGQGNGNSNTNSNPKPIGGSNPNPTGGSNPDVITGGGGGFGGSGNPDVITGGGGGDQIGGGLSPEVAFAQRSQQIQGILSGNNVYKSGSNEVIQQFKTVAENHGGQGQVKFHDNGISSVKFEGGFNPENPEAAAQLRQSLIQSTIEHGSHTYVTGLTEENANLAKSLMDQNLEHLGLSEQISVSVKGGNDGYSLTIAQAGSDVLNGDQSYASHYDGRDTLDAIDSPNSPNSPLGNEISNEQFYVQTQQNNDTPSSTRYEEPNKNWGNEQDGGSSIG